MYTRYRMSRFESVRLSTQRLDLIAATSEHLEAELKSPERLAVLLNADLEAGWPPGEYDRDAQKFFLNLIREEGAAAAGWYSWYALYRVSPRLPMIGIGAGGYCGPPHEKCEVEIGFSVMPLWRCQGYASEIAAALTFNAFMDSRVDKVIAHTDPENAASTRVLGKCRFTNAGRNESSGCYRFEITRDGGAYKDLV